MRCPAVLARHKTLYTNRQARTTGVVLGLSLMAEEEYNIMHNNPRQFVQ